jgi:Undecaprenyl-phosphate glucose phosphotransferase
MQRLASRDANRYAAEAASLPRRRRGGSAVIAAAAGPLADCFLLADFAAVVLAGYAACVPHGEMWAGVRLDVVMAGVAAPFVLRERIAAWGTAAARRAPLISRATARVAVLLGLIWAAEIVSRTAGDLPTAWLVRWSCGIVLLTMQPRALLLGYLRRLERDGVPLQAVAVIGAGPAADRAIRELRAAHGASLRIAGVFDDRGRRLPQGVIAPQGSVADLIALAQAQRIDRVVIALPWSAEARVLDILHRVKALDVEVTLSPPSLHELGGGEAWVRLPEACLCRRPLEHWGVVLKAVEDKLLAALLLLCLAPVLALLALAVKLDSPGPVLFRQKRVGLNNRPFDILKFRSMRWQPEAEGAGLRQTARDDARVTPLGRYLRRASLDELPQLFNVLRGEMSLVGPRPHAVTMRTQNLLGDEIIAQYAHRHRVKPGLTGWAQINGLRGATLTTEQLRRRVEHDLWYIDHWSIWLDLKILVLTPAKVLGGDNAF